MASGEEAVTEEAADVAVDVTEIIPTSIEDVNQIWLQAQDLVAACLLYTSDAADELT